MIDKALKAGVKNGENNILYSNTEETNKDGNLVRGFNDVTNKVTLTWQMETMQPIL